MIPLGALAVPVAALLQALALPGPFLGCEHDDAMYVLAARALADEGAYRFATVPGFPRIGLFPPGLPLLLAPFAWAFPERPGTFALAAWSWLVLCDVLAWIWLRRRLGSPLGTAAFFLFALHPLLLARAGVVMPEVPFLAVALGFLLAAERPRRSPTVEGSLVAAGWLIRPGAVALLPALLAGPMVKRRPLDVLTALAPLGACMALWAMWTGGPIAEFGELAATRALAPLTLLTNAVGSAGYYAGVVGASVWPAGVPGSVLPGVILLSMALVGLRRELRRDPADPGAWTVIGWCALHLVWPWRFERYLVPVWPFLLVSFIKGAQALGERLRKPRVEPALALTVGLLLLQSVLSSWRPLLSPQIPSAPPLARTYAWIRDNVPPSGVLASLLWARDTVHAQRAFVPVPDEGSEADLLRRFGEQRVGHVLWTRVPDIGLPRGSATEAVLRRLDGLTRSWPVAFSDAAEHARVLRVPQQAAPTGKPRRAP